MGGNIFSNIRRIEYPDFTGDRARYEALKHAELQRKLQTQQALQQQAQFTHTQEGWQRDAAYQRALSEGPLTDPETGLLHPEAAQRLMGIDARKTLDLNKSIADQVKSKLEADAKAQERREHHQKLGFYDFTSAMGIEDPQKRFEHTMSRFDRYEKLGVLQQDELEDLATNGMTPKLIDRVGTRLLGPEEYGKIQAQALTRQEALAKAASEAKTRPAEEQVKLLAGDLATKKAAGVRLFNANSPEEWDKAINSLPEDERAQWMGKPFNQKNRYKALTLGQTPTEILTQERLATPNTAKELILRMNRPDATPEEKAADAKTLEQMQAYDVSVAEASAGAKPMSAESSKVYAVAQSLIPEARLLQEAIRTGGRKALLQIMTKSDPKLARLADSVADKVGRLRSGGAVNAGEEARFMAQLARWADLLGDDQDMSAPLDAIERLIGEAGTVSGGMRPGQTPPAGATQQPTAQPKGPAPKVSLNDVMLKPGDVESGYRFLGGDPKNQANWQKVK